MPAMIAVVFEAAGVAIAAAAASSLVATIIAGVFSVINTITFAVLQYAFRRRYAPTRPPRDEPRPDHLDT